MTLVLDVDGVIADFCGAVDDVVRKLNEKYVPTWQHWEVEKNIPAFCVPIVQQELCKPGFAFNMRAFPGAVEAVRAALDEGLDIVFGTAPMSGSRTWADDRREWLYERFGHVEVVSLDNKFRIRGDALCDDKPGHLEAWPTNARYLVDRPYNQGALPFTHHRIDHVRAAIEMYRAGVVVGKHVFQ